LRKETKKMKTLIVGTGVIGTIYGWALAEAGVDVIHYVRPGKSEQYRQGVDLDLLDERKGHPANNQTHYNLRCVEEVRPGGGYELVIVPVNAQQVTEALQALIRRVGADATFLILTSNWEGTAEIDALLPRERYLLGYADGGGTVRNGVYWTNLGAEIHLGALEGQSPEKLAQVKTLFEKADMKPDIQPNILHWLWVHNASAVGFAVGFAKYSELKPFLRDGALMKTCVQATQELVHLCEKRGVDAKQYPDVSFVDWPNWLVVAMMRWMWSTNKSMQRYTAHASSAGSMQATRMHYDAMLSTASELGMEVPALQSLEMLLAVKKD
jgi:2-dehydropantoate 2-reductase